MSGVIVFFVLKNGIFSSHMKQVSQKINYTNHNIHQFYQISKIVIDLGNNTGVGNYDSSPKLTYL